VIIRKDDIQIKWQNKTSPVPSCWDTMARSSYATWQQFTAYQVNAINLSFFPFLRNTIELLHKQQAQQQSFYYAVLFELKWLIWCCSGNAIICIDWQCIMFVTCSTMHTPTMVYYAAYNFISQTVWHLTISHSMS